MPTLRRNRRNATIATIATFLSHSQTQPVSLNTTLSVRPLYTGTLPIPLRVPCIDILYPLSEHLPASAHKAGTPDRTQLPHNFRTVGNTSSARFSLPRPIDIAYIIVDYIIDCRRANHRSEASAEGMWIKWAFISCPNVFHIFHHQLVFSNQPYPALSSTPSSSFACWASTSSSIASSLLR